MISERKSSASSLAGGYLKLLLVVIVAALLVRTFLVDAFKIASASMQPTLEVGDAILVDKLSYGLRIPLTGRRLLALRSPQRGDVVVFEFHGDRVWDFAKRVVGISGDVVEIRHKQLWINGRPADDPHAVFTAPERDGSGDDFGPVTVPEKHVFVMGDNRDDSEDSRAWGFVPESDIEGRTLLIYWSADADGRRMRWSRLGSVIR